MAARADGLCRSALRAASAALALALAGCSGVPDVGSYAFVLQDRYVYNSCQELTNQRAHWTAREKELAGLVAKAESTPAGFLVSAASYRSELVQARAHLRFIGDAQRQKGCPETPR
jgi:hypothetical protein